MFNRVRLVLVVAVGVPAEHDLRVPRLLVHVQLQRRLPGRRLARGPAGPPRLRGHHEHPAGGSHDREPARSCRPLFVGHSDCRSTRRPPPRRPHLSGRQNLQVGSKLEGEAVYENQLQLRRYAE